MPKMQVILFAAALLCARASAVAVVPSSSSTQPIQPTTSSSQTTSTQPSVTPTPEMMPEMPTMDMSFGADPHFSVALPTGDMLCYTIQGEKNMIFNLITSNKLVMNALFIGDKRREEVTWIGEIGIIIPNGISQNVSSLVFNAKTKKINIERKTELFAGSISKITIDGGKISVATGYIVLKEPKVEVVLRDIDVTLSVKFFDGHLDLFWHSTGVGNEDSHGLIGQFFRKGVSIDKTRKILLLPNKEPVPVMQRPLWAFMERENDRDQQLCWTAMNPGYQGKMLIDFDCIDYRVEDIYSDTFGTKSLKTRAF